MQALAAHCAKLAAVVEFCEAREVKRSAKRARWAAQYERGFRAQADDVASFRTLTGTAAASDDGLAAALSAWAGPEGVTQSLAAPSSVAATPKHRFGAVATSATELQRRKSRLAAFGSTPRLARAIVFHGHEPTVGELLDVAGVCKAPTTADWTSTPRLRAWRAALLCSELEGVRSLVLRTRSARPSQSLPSARRPFARHPAVDYDDAPLARHPLALSNFTLLARSGVSWHGRDGDGTSPRSIDLDAIDACTAVEEGSIAMRAAKPATLILTELPSGWRTESKLRKSGASAGRPDLFFISPAGKRFRSKIGALRYASQETRGSCSSGSTAPQLDAAALDGVTTSVAKGNGNENYTKEEEDDDDFDDGVTEFLEGSDDAAVESQNAAIIRSAVSGLPRGWRAVLKVRQSGNSAGQTDISWFSPAGTQVLLRVWYYYGSVYCHV